MREKAIAIGVMLMLVMTFTPVSAAQEDVPPYPGLFCPDSPLYGLKIALENIDEAVSRSADAKLDKQVAHAEERIVEAKVMIEKGKPEAAEKAMEGYTAKAAAIDATATKPNVTEKGLQHAHLMLSKHEAVLQGLIGDPNILEQYEPALQRALNKRRTAEDTLNRVIAKMVPEEGPIEESPEAPPTKGEKKGDKKNRR
ncbi:MAG: DUF5667 domain-containing protein [Euryarchaeota archaeon]|nr:DUF5667 domain-containing protein [Euryarchaeota archaeon]